MTIGACYIRVSTDDQTEYSPDAQLKALKDYAKKNDIILSKEFIFIDEGISGKRADKRPAFMRMIALAKSKPKPFDVILVHKFDRFARSREDSVVYKSLLRKEAGVKVVSITESIEDDKFSVILEAMLEAMAEYYSLNLADEVLKGMTEKAHRGEHQSFAPFGYKLVDKKLVVDEENAKYVRLIFEKFASREMGMRALAVYLNELGIKTRFGNGFENRSVDWILNNPAYIGKTRWTPGKMKRNFNHPDSIIVDGSHEPIIAQELWDKAQEVIKENKEMFPKRMKKTSQVHTWLHGLVRCGHCGYTLVISHFPYMQCNYYAKGKCNFSQSIKKDVLEELVLEEVRKAYTGQIEINVEPKETDVHTKDEYILLKSKLEKLSERYSRIKIAYQDGIDTLDEYKQNKMTIEAEENTTKARLEALQQHLMEPDSEPIYRQIENAYALLNDPNIDIDLKYKTAHFLISKIVFNKQEKTMQIVFK